MHRVALVLACLAWTGHGRRMQRAMAEVKGSVDEEKRISEEALAKFFLGLHPAAAWSAPSAKPGRSLAAGDSSTVPVSRRNMLQQAAAAAAVLTSAARPASAALSPQEQQEAVLKWNKDFQEGQNLLPFIDSNRGFKIYKPGNWNEFNNGPDGEYEVKWSDVIEQDTAVQISVAPSGKYASIKDLGEPDKLGLKFAKKRDAELVAAVARQAGGYDVFEFEMKGDLHEILVLTISGGKLWRVNCLTSNKKWPKREKNFKIIANSFVPQGF
mmetsp:Transcript_158717/g.280353  ORF Transcript_158717/g.280353 Transcript_158717/m.280353 type:complete len:269 (+) Transcript_158717:97-903(+)